MLARCPYCSRHFNVDYDNLCTKFKGSENEFLQNECLKIQKRIDKLQYKHDCEDLTGWKLDNVNMQLSALRKIQEILERCI